MLQLNPYYLFHNAFISVLQNTEQQVQGVLNLIDLAGSERLSRSGATGERLKETQVSLTIWFAYLWSWAPGEWFNFLNKLIIFIVVIFRLSTKVSPVWAMSYLLWQRKKSMFLSGIQNLHTYFRYIKTHIILHYWWINQTVLVNFKLKKIKREKSYTDVTCIIIDEIKFHCSIIS